MLSKSDGAFARLTRVCCVFWASGRSIDLGRTTYIDFRAAADMQCDVLTTSFGRLHLVDITDVLGYAKLLRHRMTADVQSYC